MGRRNREESVVPSSLSDALLFTTMWIIGLPVDVHVKDGSVYSGIFHTACVENNYGIVLKKARLTKKGNCYANVASGDVIETLVVQSEDLVQVVAKGIVPPPNGIACNVTGDDARDIVDTVISPECEDMEAKVKRSNKATTDRMQTNKTRQVEDGRSQGKKYDYNKNSDFQRNETIHEVQGLGSSFDNQLNVGEEIHSDIASKLLPNGAPADCPTVSVVEPNDQSQGRHPSEDSACSDAISSGISSSRTSSMKSSSESCIGSSSTHTEMVPPKSSSAASKEFKLNPGAKIFCPSFANQRSITPPAAPAVVNVAYVPDNIPVVPIASTQPEVEISTFVPRSLPAKMLPYGNLIAGNGVGDSQFSQPIIGHMGSRTQSVRYAGQYNHSIQTGPTFMHLNPQNVMVGRLGQLVYVHPVSHDVNQGAAAFSHVSTHPLLTTHQGHLTKHQGSATVQALPMCVTPHSGATGQQSFAIQNPIPLPQPSFPVIHPIPVPGFNGVFGTKFP